MASVNLLMGILSYVFAVREERPGMVGIEVEEIESLDADEIVGRGWTATIDNH